MTTVEMKIGEEDDCSINVNEELGYEEEYHTFSSESEAIEWAWDEVEKLGEL